MMSTKFIMTGAAALFGIAVVTTVVLPYLQTDQLTDDRTPPLAYQYSEEAKRGRSIYVREGCWYCHTQQVRPWAIQDGKIVGVPADADLGRPSDPRDYIYDKPHLLGTERTGPDLAHVGSRYDTPQWHIDHLKDPRAVVPGSIMPSFSYLSEQEMKDLAEYLLSLK